VPDGLTRALESLAAQEAMQDVQDDDLDESEDVIHDEDW